MALRDDDHMKYISRKIVELSTDNRVLSGLIADMLIYSEEEGKDFFESSFFRKWLKRAVEALRTE